MHTRDDFLQMATHVGDLYRMDEDTLRAAPYRKSWPCTFSVVGSVVSQAPTTSDGYVAGEWLAVGVFYGHEKPAIGDSIENLRLYRNRQLVKERLRVAGVVPMTADGVYQLLLTESSVR